MNPCLKWALLLATMYCTSLLSAVDGERVPPPKPFIFSFGGLSDKQIESMKAIPGVQEIGMIDGRTRVVFQPFNENPWGLAAGGKPKWIKGAEQFYDFIAIKNRIGNTRWTHGNMVDHNSATVIWYGPTLSGSEGAPIVFGIMFDDLNTGRNEVMRVTCYSSCEPGQLEHEMLRGLNGLLISVEKCGNGHALVARGKQEVRVAWQVSNQIFATIDFTFDPEMVASYINRLGSITPPDFNAPLDKWIENEIRWRMRQIDFSYNWEIKNDVREHTEYDIRHLIAYFPDVGTKFGLPPKDGSPDAIWPYLWKYRNFLWANRRNFKYQSTGWYVLKDIDLFDPNQPPELPDELLGPAKPSEDRTKVKPDISKHVQPKGP